MARSIVREPNTVLRTKARVVAPDEIGTEKVSTLVAEMLRVMQEENGVGIAAPQVGESVRVIIAETPVGPRAFVNPEIIRRSWRTSLSEEGCLSVPGVFGLVKRHRAVTVRAMTPEGKSETLKAGGLLSVIFQHEIDHLDGILFIDKVVKYTQPPKTAL